MNKINYIELGATLFVPPTHKNIEDIIIGKKYPDLKSVLIDTEDGLSEDKLALGLSALKKLLLIYEKNRLLVFVRPKNVAVLQEILLYEGITKIDGFVLPKFSLTNANEYFALLQNTEFSLMPSIECRELFEQSKLQELKEIILTNIDKIVLVRFGLEDILRQLSLKRIPNESAFDLSAINAVLGNFIATFKSVGFSISGGVYPYFNDEEGFIKDVKRDLKEGLFSKTIIHPKQINAVNNLYMVTKKELYEARQICQSKEAAFNLDGKMAESVTMTPYAQTIIQRAEVYGVISPKEEQSL